MALVITASIILIIVGLLLIIFAKETLVFEKWKYNSDTEPSQLYIISKRIGGCVLIVVGVVCLLIYTIIGHQDSYWNAAYKTDTANLNYWTFYEDGTLEQSTRGTYSFLEKDGELLVQLLPEGEESDTTIFSYVMKFDNEKLSLIPYIYYFEQDTLEQTFENYEDEVLSIEDVTLTYEFVDGDPIGNTEATNINAVYQMLKNGKKIPYTCRFHMDGTYEETATINYNVNSDKMILKIGKVNYSYAENPVTNELLLYFDDDVLLTFEKIPDCGIPE